MDFEKLVEVYEKLESISSGNEMRDILAEFFKSVSKDDIAMISYLTLGEIASEYESVVLGMAEKGLVKAISTAGGAESSKVKQLLHKTGDAGLTAEKILEKKPQTLIPLGTLTVHELFEKLHKVAKMSGSGSQDTKTSTLASLLAKASSKGAKYIVRIALGQLRMGVGDMTVLDALAIAFTGEKKNKEVLEKAYNICPDVGVIAETIAKKGLKGLEKIKVVVGRPIKMMLAQRVKELSEVSSKIPGKVAVEAKYDGERIQVHQDKDGKISLFSRRLDNITAQFPDLVGHLEKEVDSKEFIFEGEVLAIDSKGNHLPFQTLMQRRRKNDIEEYIKKIPVQLKVFDVLYVDGKNVMDEGYEKRSARIEKMLVKEKGLRHIVPADKIETDNVEKMDEFFQKMLDEKYEGIIIKSLGGGYQAGTRGWNWIKWKKDYVQDLADTIDLVVVGGYYGRGKRSGVFGALLCAAYDERRDEFLTVCKLGTGLTDEMLAELPKKLKKSESAKKPARVVVKKEMEPDVWFTPDLVVEVLAAEVTKSPFHTAGVALRFPRFVRLRDKKAEQSTSVNEIEEMM